MPVLQNDKVKGQMFQVRVETFLLHSSTPTALCGYFSKDKKGTKQVLILEATDSWMPGGDCFPAKVTLLLTHSESEHLPEFNTAEDRPTRNPLVPGSKQRSFGQRAWTQLTELRSSVKASKDPEMRAFLPQWVISISCQHRLKSECQLPHWQRFWFKTIKVWKQLETT